MPGTGEAMSAGAVWLGATAAAVVTAVLAAIVRARAQRVGLVDRPGARSAHYRVTPTGGGIAMAIVIVASLAWAALAAPVGRAFAATAAAAVAIAALGLRDDRQPLPARYRLLVQLATISAWLSLLPQWPLSAATSPAHWLVVFILLLLAATWCVNLYNFMDGIDGIASVQALTVFTAAAVLLSADTAGDWRWLLPCWAGAAAGFLALNRPPAKLFMGDCGSGLLGFAVAAAAFGTVAAGQLTVPVWLILMACFFADSTVTLLVRAVRGERLAEGHRSHAYQILSRRWRSHGRVVLLVAGINVVWLSPLAWLAAAVPGSGPIIAVIAYTPVVAGVLWFGAGRAPMSV